MKLFLFLLLFPSLVYAQQTINGLNIKGKLNVSSTKDSSKPCPDMTEAQRDLILSPDVGSCVYNMNALSLNIYDGAAWKVAGGGISLWVTLKDYKTDDVVIYSDKIYQAVNNHTSSSFVTDLASGEWKEISASGISNWVTAINYVIGNVVIESDKIYQAILDHTSSIFLTDLSGGNWKEISGQENLTGHIVSTGNATFLGSFSSSNLLTALTDETGTGAAVFANTPTLVAPILGNATGTSLSLGGTKAASAALDIQSTTQGVLPPRMTTAQMNAIVSPATGLTIYNTDINSLASWNGTTWNYGFGSLTPWTNMTSYTPTFTGASGLAAVDVKWQQRGDMIKGIGVFNITSGTAITMTLPNGMVIDPNKISTSNYMTVGSSSISTFGGFTVTVLAQGNLNTVTFGLTGPSIGTSANNPYTSWGAERIQFYFEVPIKGLTSNTSAWVQANSNPIATTTELNADILASAGTISKDTMGLLASCTAASPSICTFTSGLFGSDAPSCLASSGSNAGATENGVSAMANVLSATQVAVGAINTGTGGYITGRTITLSCRRTGANLRAAHSPFIIGTFAELGIKLGTSVASTSGTSIDFTIPANVKRVTIMFNENSTNGTSSRLVQIGSGSIQTSGYLSSSSILNTVASGQSSTAGMTMFVDNASNTLSGTMTINLFSGSTWIATHSGKTAASQNITGGGSVTLSGSLDRLRFTTVNGTDTFDAGNVNVSWEY